MRRDRREEPKPAKERAGVRMPKDLASASAIKKERPPATFEILAGGRRSARMEGGDGESSMTLAYTFSCIARCSCTALVALYSSKAIFMQTKSR
jgi:hypothetical protein